MRRASRPATLHPVITAHEPARLRVSARWATTNSTTASTSSTRSLAGANFPFVCANLVQGPASADDPRKDTSIFKPYVILDKTITRRRRQAADDQARLHRLRAAADHDLGSSKPRRQGRRRATSSRPPRPGCAEMQGAGCRSSSSRSAIPASTGGQHGRHVENASLYPRRRSMASTSSSPATSIWCSPAPRISTARQGVDAGKGTLMGKPAVMAGFWGSHLGLIDLLLEKRRRRLVHRLPYLRGPPDLRPRRQAR